MMDNVEAIAAGGELSIILKADGSIWGFGTKFWGLDYGRINYYVPFQLSCIFSSDTQASIPSTTDYVLAPEPTFIIVTNENELRIAINENATQEIHLNNDIELLSTLIIPEQKNVVFRSIDNQEFRLVATRNFDVININNGATLSINNIAITRNDGTTGRGVNNSGTFIMNSGVIAGNISSWNGGGVYNNGKFIMNGGVIENNRASNSGGGVANQGEFTLFYGMINNNVGCNVTGFGGGILNSNIFIMHGGIIENNQIANGGGLHIVREQQQYSMALLNKTERMV